MPSFSDSLFLFVLALLLFGPKRLPVLARELGKWIGEFRRASNEFKMQMEDELRVSEQAERQKQIAAMEAAAPVPPPVIPEPEHPHLPAPSVSEETTAVSTVPGTEPVGSTEPAVTAPLPIATSGDLEMLPPSTGLPVARGRNGSPLGGLIGSIPSEPDPHAESAAQSHTPVEETAAHG